jgi:hypothetical protein
MRKYKVQNKWPARNRTDQRRSCGRKSDARKSGVVTIDRSSNVPASMFTVAGVWLIGMEKYLYSCTHIRKILCTNTRKSHDRSMFMNISTLKRIMFILTGRTHITETNISRCHASSSVYIPSHRVPYESVNQGLQNATWVKQASIDRRQPPNKNGADGNRYCIGGDHRPDWPENDPDLLPLSTP